MGPFPAVHMMQIKSPDQEFWETIFTELMADAHDPQDAAKYADEALNEWRKRWPQRQIEAPQLPPFPNGQSWSTLDNLIQAQKDLEAARERLACLGRIRDEMPEEFADAWWGVEGVPAEARVRDAEQWVKNIQEQMEKNAEPPASGGRE